MAESPRTTGRENLYRADGSRRPDAEVLKEVGNIGLRLALLDDAMNHRAASADPDLHYPPRLFLLYEWASETEIWLSAKDPALLMALRESAMILVSFDRASLPMHAGVLTREGLGHTGIILFKRLVSVFVESHVARDLPQSAGLFKNDRLVVWEFSSKG